MKLQKDYTIALFTLMILYTQKLKQESLGRIRQVFDQLHKGNIKLELTKYDFFSNPKFPTLGIYSYSKVYYLYQKKTVIKNIPYLLTDSLPKAFQ